jgi:hypothetical protein
MSAAMHKIPHDICVKRKIPITVLKGIISKDTNIEMYRNIKRRKKQGNQ